ncbi:bola protein [Gigaspora rosea]|uniref:Bola protein n=1 Tax=Gigaspora rosea TaxID=44941 RepID=A0A397V4I7_9GLOM|nr:bola protein [Gigaspora rosea]
MFFPSTFRIFQRSISFTNPLLFRTLTTTLSLRADNNNRSETLTEGEKYLYEKLFKKFQPTKLHVQDISGGCGSMYAIEISSSQFNGLSMIKQHRMVNELLEDDIKKMHGIRLITST